MDDRARAIEFIREYIMKNYAGVDNIRIRELNHDQYTGNWTSHTSFNDIERSYEIALVFNEDKIIFVKEFI
ncbi:MAG: hypothetical protein RE471_08405 [Ferroplasma sp.]|uniref:hypothetical protein n=1 Tax=Ferroplasma sp. TaxID=2591003 RepID=UPI002814D539|nr:hypothetical protein [Ferroplasma sp.]WMT50988.1 MAG: hypothetical protein RE471_08405 [Ferroplasma sp.]